MANSIIVDFNNITDIFFSLGMNLIKSLSKFTMGHVDIEI